MGAATKSGKLEVTSVSPDNYKNVAADRLKLVLEVRECPLSRHALSEWHLPKRRLQHGFLHAANRG